MTSDSFPVDSFREAAQHLRRPFTPQAVKFKVQAVWPKDNPTGGLVVSYIDARLVVERLNLIVPHLWHDEYQATGNGPMWCALTIDGITRRDVGEGTGKGLVSDALKRAAVKFGIGVPLYATPRMILNVADGHVKQKKIRDARGQEKITLELTPAGDKHVRALYETWLKERGIEAFGEPLNHGDSENAQGDPAEAAEEHADEVPAAESMEPLVATPEQRSAIFAAAEEARMPSSLLAKTLLLATGKEEHIAELNEKWKSEQDARQWLVRALERLPADDVEKVLKAIEAPE